MKISNNNFSHHYYIAKDKKIADKNVVDEKIHNNDKPTDNDKKDNSNSLDYLINKDRDRARALREQGNRKIRNKRDNSDPTIITITANKQPEWLSSRGNSYSSEPLQQTISDSRKQAERLAGVAIRDDIKVQPSRLPPRLQKTQF